MHDLAHLLMRGARCKVLTALRRTRAAAVIARDFSSRFAIVTRSHFACTWPKAFLIYSPLYLRYRE